MAVNIGGVPYIPGMYAKRRPSAAEMANQYISEWDKRRLQAKQEQPQRGIPPTICFSRKIGVGALEVADILAEKIHYRVIDREILEHIAAEAKLSENTVSFFDERYPGVLNEFLALLFGEKSFIKSDYTRHLFSVVLSIAGLEPTVFVGRGTHLILPRDRVMAVRFISSSDHRAKRLAAVLKVEEKEAREKLDEIDKEQRDFFKRVYGKKDASPYEFDLVINCDFIKDPEVAAEIVRHAFTQKFGPELR